MSKMMKVSEFLKKLEYVDPNYVIVVDDADEGNYLNVDDVIEDDYKELVVINSTYANRYEP